ncbi:Ldh family oxidoreductase [Dichotomicrobium thermohalophilum]|uniref:(2R)-3-sulfolactate dehydrogenase (NADP+) n=1 Tax=Dichotomicrobium thermohalophilum TaxID=933063 RepID=A0A397QAC1_9HYPH|nr:Ldh family oxidoreductase [Dichotomicrobium thermohalophilum]RIA55171.1 (2R)-3-sulfolactate dehydrogenase (NADP+) [Dichotomicrobium thermohalophilum]
MTEVTISIAEARHRVEKTLMDNGVTADNAESVARALVDAEIDGQSGHGLRRVASYAAQAAVGKVDGHAVPVINETAPGALHVDVANGFYYPAFDRVAGRLPQMAKAQGIAMAGFYRSHHCGVAGHSVERLAEDGCVALMFANTPAAMAPWGGASRLFGTNPVAFAAPLEGREPVVIDLSLSKVARGKIVAAAERGEPIPEGWAVDVEGQPTTDPARAVKGAMLPFGEAKGSALALMVEMMAAGLTGGRYARDATSFLDAEGGPPETGQLIIAIDATGLSADAPARFAELASWIEADGDARLPGTRRLARRKKVQHNGLKVDRALLEGLSG